MNDTPRHTTSAQDRLLVEANEQFDGVLAIVLELDGKLEKAIDELSSKDDRIDELEKLVEQKQAIIEDLKSQIP